MCTGAILLYRIPRVVIGENSNFKGEEELLRRRGVEVVVVDSEECKELMRAFIREHPEVRHGIVWVWAWAWYTGWEVDKTETETPLWVRYRNGMKISEKFHKEAHSSKVLRIRNSGRKE